MDDTVSRRQFLGKIAGIAAALTGLELLVSCTSVELKKTPGSSIYYQKDFNISNITKANRLLLDLPERIPGAKKVEKYIIPNARYALIHIRQPHFDYGLNRRQLRQVISDQKHVYSILSYFADNHGIKAVYDEFFSEENVGEDGVSSRVTLLKLYMQTNGKNTDIYKGAKQELDAIMAYGATERISAEGKLKIKPAETAAGYHLWSFLSEKDKMDTREDIALELLSKEQGPLFVLVYGASHAWGGKTSCGPNYSFEGKTSFTDNLDVWNKVHPDKIFSLCEITPKGGVI